MRKVCGRRKLTHKPPRLGAGELLAVASFDVNHLRSQELGDTLPSFAHVDRCHHFREGVLVARAAQREHPITG